MLADTCGNIVLGVHVYAINTTDLVCFRVKTTVSDIPL